MSSPYLSGFDDAMVNHVRVHARAITTMVAVQFDEGAAVLMSFKAGGGVVQVLGQEPYEITGDNMCVWMRRRMKHALRAGTFTTSQTACMWRDLRCHRA